MHKTCVKCGSNDFGTWTSSSTGKISFYCRNCRRKRAKKYTRRLRNNGGTHTKKQWQAKLASYDKCPICKLAWHLIPKRPDKRYKHVWTKDHIVPVKEGGTDDINNIQPLCYRCNSAKCDSLKYTHLTKR